MNIRISKKLESLPPYLFAMLDAAKRQAAEAGRDVIDLGVGDPDIPTPDFIIAKLSEAAGDPGNHRYALDQGMPVLRLAIAAWYEKRFGVKLDPEKEVLPLIGSKEGIAHLPLALLNRGDVVLVPDPCYPPYRNAVILADGKPHLMPLRQGNGFLPDLEAVSPAVREKARLMFLNYPNNPTSATATPEFFKRTIDFAAKNNIVVAHDAAYSELTFDDFRPPSFLAFPGGKETGIEFHSLSKTFNMTGWRIGWVCGNAEVIAALAKLKSNFDSGIFQAIQLAGVCALENADSVIAANKKIYQERRDMFISGLQAIGFDVELPKATFYVWVQLPKKARASIEFARMLLQRANIVVTPGVGFGKYGEGYIRFALTQDKARLKEALERMRVYLVDVLV